MYADTWQYLVAYQGATVEEFHYWLPMGNYCFTSFQLPHGALVRDRPVHARRTGRG